MQRCWEVLPSDRPSFTDIIAELEDIQAQAQVRPQTLIVAFKRILRIAQKKLKTLIWLVLRMWRSPAAVAGNIRGVEPETKGWWQCPLKIDTQHVLDGSLVHLIWLTWVRIQATNIGENIRNPVLSALLGANFSVLFSSYAVLVPFFLHREEETRTFWVLTEFWGCGLICEYSNERKSLLPGM